MPKLLLLRGLPGSGKSTEAAKLLVPGGSWKRVNKDMLREMLDNSDWSTSNEEALNIVLVYLIEYYLGLGFNVVSDNMNLDPRNIERLVNILNAPAEIEVREIQTPLEECIARDALRPKPVGEAVIREIAARWMPDGEMPCIEELIKVS